MRCFIAKNESNVVVDKQVLVGDEQKINALMAQYVVNHPGLTVEELDEAVFNQTAVTVPQTQIQKDWATFKATAPTPLQSILYLAKAIGLE